MSKDALTHLGLMKQKLEKLASKTFKKKYFVPALWVEAGESLHDGAEAVSVNPAEFYLRHINAVEKYALQEVKDPCRSLNTQLKGGEGGSWVNGQVFYNMFVRASAAYDHNQDGVLGGDKKDITMCGGYRESGTFLKAIAMLGYLKAIGCSVIHLLPITAIGHDGNKGDLGSPYAIRNPYKIEETLADPLVDMDAEAQFMAFIEAAHKLGIRVVCEFVFRTASKDADWIAEHPDWFYWIDESAEDRDPSEKDPAKIASTYGNPMFTEEELKVIKEKVANHDLNDLIPPHKEFKNFFKKAPRSTDVYKNKLGQYRAKVKDEHTGKEITVRIPGAFADWPPDDNQPPWGDVTYYKMYVDENEADPEFNYIAYNTIRMYDNKLARTELANKGLWESIIELVPTYQQKYGIDGVMIDMGHAVPNELMKRLISRAREIDPNFAFISENFEISQSSVDAGYNAVVGYSWWVEYKRDGMYNMLEHIGCQGVPLGFFGAVETHDVPRACGRAGGDKYGKYAFLVNTMLPRAIPYIHSGQELNETTPVNTGLDFSDEDLARLKNEKLPLFNQVAYHWDGKHSMLGFMQKVLKIRQDYANVVDQTDPEAFCTLLTGHIDVISFIRRWEGRHLMVMFNRDLEEQHSSEIDLNWCLPNGCTKVTDLIEGAEFEVKYGRLKYTLQPGEAVCFGW